MESKSSSNLSASLVPTLVIPIIASHSHGCLLEVDTGVVGSDLCLFASFSPAESSECSFSVSLAASSNLGNGACGKVGGPFCLRLLPAVGCELSASAKVYCVEDFQQLLRCVLAQLSEQPATTSAPSSSNKGKMRMLHTYYFLQVISNQSPESLLASDQKCSGSNMPFQDKSLGRGTC